MSEQDTKTPEQIKAEEEAARLAQKESSTRVVEALAEKLGWKKDFEGDGAVDAETFILRSREIQSNLNKKIHSMKRDMGAEIEALNESLNMLVEQSKENIQSDVKKIEVTIEQLEAERVKAIENADSEQYQKLTKQIRAMRDEAGSKKAAATKSGPTTAYKKWVGNGNEWYEQDSGMRRWADTLVDTDLKGLPPQKIFEIIGKKAREFFPEKFEHEKPQANANKKTQIDPDDTDINDDPEKRKAAAVANPSRKTTKGKKKFTFEDLSYSQKKVAEQMVMKLKGTKGEMTKDQYANKLLGGDE